MTDHDVMTAPTTTTPPARAETVEPPFIAAPQPTATRPVILDMGEESREQGFRLNGCR